MEFDLIAGMRASASLIASARPRKTSLFATIISILRLLIVHDLAMSMLAVAVIMKND